MHGKSVILLVVDRFSKYAHFITLGHPYTTSSVARAFFDEIVHLRGIPSSIISDRDPIFTSNFWSELFRLSGIKLNLSSAFHPQSDGQTEVVNRVIAMYLRCLFGDRPRCWVQWLPWAEFCYNSSFQTSLKSTPFRVIYGLDPPTLIAYESGVAHMDAVDSQLRDHDEFLSEIRDRLLQAQTRMEQQDLGHRNVSFTIGQWVWLRLQHQPISSVSSQPWSKLAPMYYGPFRILERIGSVAYHLELPAQARIHDVFHVALLKPHRGDPPEHLVSLLTIVHGRVVPTPETVVNSRRHRGVCEFLVRWQGLPVVEATWEPLLEFCHRYPEF